VSSALLKFLNPGGRGWGLLAESAFWTVTLLAGALTPTWGAEAVPPLPIGSTDGRIQIVPFLSGDSLKNGEWLTISALVTAEAGVARVTAEIEDIEESVELEPEPLSAAGARPGGSRQGLWRSRWRAHSLEERRYVVRIDVEDAAGHRFSDASLSFSDPVVGVTEIGGQAYPAGGLRLLERGDAGSLPIGSAVFNPQTSFLYLGTDTLPGSIIKVKVTSAGSFFSSALELPATEGRLREAALQLDPTNDLSFAYFGAYTSPGKIIKVWLNDNPVPGGGSQAPVRIGTLSFQTGEDFVTALALDTAQGFGYAGTQNFPARVVKFGLGLNFAHPFRIGAAPLASGENMIGSGVIDPARGYGLFGTSTSPGRVIKVALGQGADPPRRVGGIVLPEGENSLEAATIDLTQGFAYFGTSTSPGKLIKIGFGTGESPPERVGAVTLISTQPGGTSEHFLEQVATDPIGGRAFFIAQNPTESRVVKIGFTPGGAAPEWLGSFGLGPTDGRAKGIAIDPVKKELYIGTGGLTQDPEFFRLSYSLRGFIHGTRVTLDEPAEVQTAHFFSHVASGSVRLGVYELDRVSNVVLRRLWVSNFVPNTAAGDWLTVPIADGDPNLLVLQPGTFYLAWQIDAHDDVPSFSSALALPNFRVSPGTDGDFPRNILLTGANQGVGAWSMYLSFTTPIPNVEVTGGPEIDFGIRDVDAGPTSARTVRVINTGTATLFFTGPGVQFLGPDAGQFRISTDTGQSSLDRLSSRTLNLVFDPTSEGPKSASLRITTNDPDTPTVDISLAGVGVRAEIDVTPLAIAFGEQDVQAGPTAPRTVLITNVGTAPLAFTGDGFLGDDKKEPPLGSVHLSGAGAAHFRITSDTRQLSLLPGQTRTVMVAFDPATTGTLQANLTITSRDFDESTVNVALSGVGIDERVFVSPSPGFPVAFAPRAVGGDASDPVVVTIANVGTAPMTFGSPALEFVGDRPENFALVADSGLNPVLPNQARTAALVFRPRQRGPSGLTFLSIRTSDSRTPQVLLQLTGEGRAPVASLAPSSLDFGTLDLLIQTVKSSGPLNINNTGDLPLRILNGGIEIVGPDADDFLIIPGSDTGEEELEPLQSRTFRLRFRPTTGGPKSAAARIRTSDPARPVLDLPLKGFAIQRGLEAAPPALDFGEIDLRQGSSPQSVVVTNRGNVDLNFTGPGVQIDSSNFRFVQAPDVSPISPGASRSFSIRLGPVDAVGDVSANLTISSDATTAPALVNLTGTITNAPLRLTQMPVIFGPHGVDDGPSNPTTVTLRNKRSSTQTFAPGALSLAGLNPGDFLVLDDPTTVALAPMETRLFSVAFDPSAAGSRSAVLSITSNLGSVTGSLLGVGLDETVTFAAATSSDVESAPSIVVPVRLDEPAHAPGVTVDFRIVGGTAVNGVDYDAPTTGRLTFPEGALVQTIVFTPRADQTLGEDKTVLLNLSNAIGAVLGEPSAHTLTILDDSPRPTIGFLSSGAIFNERATTATLPVRILGNTTRTATVKFATFGGTAIEGFDFRAAGGTLSFPPGETGRTITIELRDNALADGLKTLTVRLSDPVNAVLGLSDLTLVIADDESPSAVRDWRLYEDSPPKAGAPSHPPVTPGASRGNRPAPD